MGTEQARKMIYIFGLHLICNLLPQLTVPKLVRQGLEEIHLTGEVGALVDYNILLLLSIFQRNLQRGKVKVSY